MGEFIIELIFELIMDGSVSICKSKKVSKWIRYPLIFLVSLISLGFVGIVLVTAFDMMDDSIIGGLAILAIAIFFLVCMIREIIKTYKEKKSEQISLSNQNVTSVTNEASDLTPSSDFFYYRDYDNDFKNN